MKFRPTVIYLLATMLLSHAGKAQDTLVQIQDLTFNSEFEKKTFEEALINKKEDHFSLAVANGQVLNDSDILKAKDRFYGHLKLIDSDKFKAKKNDKKIKQVYDDIHKTFLSKYEIRNRFEDIFSDGNYNCVSATMLYGLAFQQLGIPFHIIEKPTHVYLVAFPDNESIVVETTAPTIGYFTPSDQFKQNYVKVLKDQKLISAKEFASTEMNALFEKHYFGEFKNIGLTELAGLQYMNDGLYYLDEEAYLQALHQFEKAYVLYPSDRVGYLLMLSSYNAFNTSEKTGPNHALALAKLSRYKKFGIKGDIIQAEFVKVIQDLLFDKNDQASMENYYKTFIAQVRDKELGSELSFIYYYEFGRMFHNRSEFEEGLPYLEEVLKIKPNNADGNSLFLNCLFRSMRNENNQKVITSLNAYGIKYPFLFKNSSFIEMLLTAYLLEFDRSYQQNNATLGEKYRLLFEDLVKNHPDTEPDQYTLANAYSSGALYYFRKGQNSKAKAILTAGLAISPENFALKERKRMIE
jgi:tetratricopeptide (TPR) repeat protein